MRPIHRFAPAILALLVSTAAPEALAERTRPHPDAPPETAQFAFLIGDWQCATRSMTPDGQGWKEGQARWRGYYILDGWAIQDDWTSEGLNGDFHGTNVRSFNPETGKWDNRWLASGNLQWQYFAAEKVGDTMVMTGGEGRDPRGEYVDRNTFYDIGAEGWRWKKDRSWDGGETWLTVAHIEARRSGR